MLRNSPRLRHRPPRTRELSLETFGTTHLSHDEILRRVNPEGVNAFRPARIIERLNLRRPIFRPTATFGHFGREEFPWEQS